MTEDDRKELNRMWGEMMVLRRGRDEFVGTTMEGWYKEQLGNLYFDYRDFKKYLDMKEDKIESQSQMA